MQERDKLVIGILVGVLVLVVVGGGWWFKKTRPVMVEVPAAEQGIGPGEVGYQEPKSKTAVGSKEVSRGIFEKVEGGKLYYTEGGVQTVIPLTSEVAIQCTGQELENIAEYDYNQVAKVRIVVPGEVADIVTADQPIVVLATKEGEVFRANTVAVAADKCGI